MLLNTLQMKILYIKSYDEFIKHLYSAVKFAPSGPAAMLLLTNIWLLILQQFYLTCIDTFKDLYFYHLYSNGQCFRISTFTSINSVHFTANTSIL